jgi:hypothetical protein
MFNFLLDFYCSIHRVNEDLNLLYHLKMLFILIVLVLHQSYSFVGLEQTKVNLVDLKTQVWRFLATLMGFSVLNHWKDLSSDLFVGDNS